MSAHGAILVVLAVIFLALVTRGGRDRQPPRRGHRTPARRARCRTGKVQFDSKADADRVVHRSQTKRREGYDRPLERSYRCPDCGRWHTTSQRNRART
jgi:hypothetical protein